MLKMRLARGLSALRASQFTCRAQYLEKKRDCFAVYRTQYLWHSFFSIRTYVWIIFNQCIRQVPRLPAKIHRGNSLHHCCLCSLIDIKWRGRGLEGEEGDLFSSLFKHKKTPGGTIWQYDNNGDARTASHLLTRMTRTCEFWYHLELQSNPD